MPEAVRLLLDDGMTKPKVMGRMDIKPVTALERLAGDCRADEPKSSLPDPEGAGRSLRSVFVSREEELEARMRLRDLPKTPRLLQRRGWKGRRRRANREFSAGAPASQAGDRRHEIQGRGNEGLPVSGDRPVRQRGRGLLRIEESEHGAGRRDASPARNPRAGPFPCRTRARAGSTGRKPTRRSWGLGITQGMSRKATCLDNVRVEGFFGRMKDEFCRRRFFGSFEEFEARLSGRISFWNNRRYRTGLKGMTPAQYRGHSIGAA